MMLVAIEGVYRRGKVVTFLPVNGIDLQTRGIDEAKAAELRTSLTTFAEDWDSPEMSIYDNYSSPE